MLALNPTYRILLNFAKSRALSCLLKVDNIKIFHRAVFELKDPKVVLRVFLGSHTVAMVTYCVTKLTSTCSPMIGQFFSYHDWSIKW